MHIVSSGGNLHEMSKPVFFGVFFVVCFFENKKNTIIVSSAENFTQSAQR